MTDTTVPVTQALPDPNDPRYQAARVAMAEQIRAIQRDEPKSGYGRMADQLMRGDLYEVPTWLALGMLAAEQSRASTPAVDREAIIAQAERLRDLFAKVTPGDLSTAERHIESETVECPICQGDGEVEAADYCNFDGAALGVQFYGIGNEFGAHEALWTETVKALPSLLDAILALHPPVMGEVETEAFRHLTNVLFADPGPKLAASRKAAEAWWHEQDSATLSTEQVR